MQKPIFDADKLTILEGFGISTERMNLLIEKYIHGSRNDIIVRIVNDESLPPNERYALLINLGVLLVGVVVEEMGTARVMTDRGA